MCQRKRWRVRDSGTRQSNKKKEILNEMLAKTL